MVLKELFWVSAGSLVFARLERGPSSVGPTRAATELVFGRPVCEVMSEEMVESSMSTRHS